MDKAPHGSPLEGSVAFTGRLASMKRATAFEHVRRHGGTPRRGVTKTTSLLVVGELGRFAQVADVLLEAAVGEVVLAQDGARILVPRDEVERRDQRVRQSLAHRRQRRRRSPPLRPRLDVVDATHETTVRNRIARGGFVWVTLRVGLVGRPRAAAIPLGKPERSR